MQISSISLEKEEEEKQNSIIVLPFARSTKLFTNLNITHYYTHTYESSEIER